MKKSMLIVGIIVTALGSGQKMNAEYADYLAGNIASGSAFATGVGIGAYLGHWAVNKYLKTPLRHIDDDVMAIQNAIERLKNRLQKTIEENDRKKWVSHTFEPERIAVIKEWLNAPELFAFGSWLFNKNQSIQPEKLRYLKKR